MSSNDGSDANDGSGNSNHSSLGRGRYALSRPSATPRGVRDGEKGDAEAGADGRSDVPESSREAARRSARSELASASDLMDADDYEQDTGVTLEKLKDIREALKKLAEE